MAHETALCCRLTRQAGKAIETLDRKYGLDIPIEVIGYSCIERSTSVRSDKRVINYIIAGYQKGRTCGDLKHMLMRGAGSTRAVRQAQGYEHIRVVCTKKNWEVVQNLYDFTQDAMKLAATGRVEDLATWTSADYRVEYLELVSSTRPMVHRTMGVVDLSRVQCIQQPMPAAAAAAPASKRRSEDSATSAMDQDGSSDLEASRPSKQHRQSKATNASWHRFMRCIWEVCRQQRSRAILRAQLMQFCDRAEAWISRQEIDSQYTSTLTSLGHYVKVDRPGEMFTLTKKGQQSCHNMFGGVLRTDE